MCWYEMAQASEEESGKGERGQVASCEEAAAGTQAKAGDKEDCEGESGAAG